MKLSSTWVEDNAFGIEAIVASGECLNRQTIKVQQLNAIINL